MRNFCAVYCLAVSFCLLSCVFVNATVPQATAKEAVDDLKEFVTTVRDKAQSQLDSAKGLLAKVELSKTDAAQASSHAEEVAKGNTEAVRIAQTIKSLSGAVDTLYSDVKAKLTTAVSTLTELLTEAKGLDDGSTIEILAKGDKKDDFTEANQKAAALKDKATELDGRINTAVTQVDGVRAKADEITKNAKEAQLGDSHVSAFVAVATIKSMLENADTIISQIEEKKREVSEIVDEMQTLQRNPTTVTDKNIEALLQSAADALNTATEAVQNATGAKADIQTQKGIANAALTKVQDEKDDVNNAKGEANTAEACVKAADQIVPKLNNGLQTAEDSLKNANNLKQQLQTALSTATSARRTEQSVTNPEVKPLHDSVSAAVNAIQTLMGEADSTLKETENRKKAVHDIVQEMTKHCTTELTQSNHILKEQCQSATDALTSVTGAAEKSQNAVTAIKEQKGLADTALENIQKTDTNVNKAQEEANAAKACVATAKQNVVQLNNALEAAKTSVAKANNAKKEIETAISKAISKQLIKQTKEKEDTNPPVVDGTVPHQKDTTIQPTITAKEQPPSKESPGQDTNIEDKLKDALINGAQNVSTTALTGGKAPAPGAKNDSAMTVSVPLLVALIASAVLQ